MAAEQGPGEQIPALISMMVISVGIGMAWAVIGSDTNHVPTHIFFGAAFFFFFGLLWKCGFQMAGRVNEAAFGILVTGLAGVTLIGLLAYTFLPDLFLGAIRWIRRGWQSLEEATRP